MTTSSTPLHLFSPFVGQSFVCFLQVLRPPPPAQREPRRFGRLSAVQTFPPPWRRRPRKLKIQGSGGRKPTPRPNLTPICYARLSHKLAAQSALVFELCNHENEHPSLTTSMWTFNFSWRLVTGGRLAWGVGFRPPERRVGQLGGWPFRTRRDNRFELDLTSITNSFHPFRT